jgi:D-alanine-D-alanine ligase-like ATP-grasp enzyme
MPLDPVKKILCEQFIQTDSVKVVGKNLRWKQKTGYVELTVGVMEEAKKLHALSPSLTVAEGAVLSVEEKFQGGTGINITPPPPEIISSKIIRKIRRSIELVAKTLNITGYCRIDIFANITTGDIIVIEVNTLPALTPSTVLFHQGLAEKNRVFPTELLERLIQNTGYEAP